MKSVDCKWISLIQEHTWPLKTILVILYALFIQIKSLIHGTNVVLENSLIESPKVSFFHMYKSFYKWIRLIHDYILTFKK